MPPRGYETFDHTADIGIRAWGKELREVFEEAAKALFSIIADLESVSPNKTRTVKLAADSAEALLLAWLQELLFIFETERIVFSQFKILSLTPTALSAEARGEQLNHSKHALGREVKAVTRHQFKLTRDTSGYLAEAILDI